jgi:transposase
LTVVADLQRHRVLFVHEDRKAESLDAFWPSCTPAQRDSITAVAIDMWEPYGAARKRLRPAGEGPAVVIA